MEIGIDAVVGGARFSYQVIVGAIADGDWSLKRETCSQSSGDVESGFSREGEDVEFSGFANLGRDRRIEYAPDDRLTLPLMSRDFGDLTEFLGGVGAYAIYPDALRSPQQLLGKGRLEDDARNLASVLRSLRRRPGTTAADPLRDALSDLVPGAGNFRVTEPGSYLAIGVAMEGDGKEMWFDAAQLSDGTLRLLAILTAIHQSPRLPVVAIEEPELTVHPGAAERLVDELVDAAHRMQVVFTTHSPDLVSLVPVDSLRVVEATDEGTKVGRVSQRDIDAVNDKLFSAGDLIRMGGLRRELKHAR